MAKSFTQNYYVMYIIIIIIIVMDKSYLLIIALFGKLMTWSESEVVPFYFEQLACHFLQDT